MTEPHGREIHCSAAATCRPGEPDGRAPLVALKSPPCVFPFCYQQRQHPNTEEPPPNRPAHGPRPREFATNITGVRARHRRLSSHSSPPRTAPPERCVCATQQFCPGKLLRNVIFRADSPSHSPAVERRALLQAQPFPSRLSKPRATRSADLPSGCTTATTRYLRVAYHCYLTLPPRLATSTSFCCLRPPRGNVF